MNTIPLIFNERQINRTVLGGKERVPDTKLKASVILLNKKGSQFRESTLKTLVKVGFEQIISIENNPEDYNIDDFSHKYPYIKFIIPLEKATEGDLINIGMSEVSSDYVMVIRDTLQLRTDFLTPRILEKLVELNLFCASPRITCEGINGFPLVFTPSVKGSVFKIEGSSSLQDGLFTLYPLDNIGLYNRKKFIQAGGFDYTITSAHWQTADLFFRSWLWGEKTSISTMFTLSYEENFPVEDITADLSYSRFYMKNLLPRFDADHGVIPKSSFLVYLLRSGCGLLESLRQFKDARQWVFKNKYRFRYDAKYLVENWGKI